MRLRLIAPTWEDPELRRMKGKAFRLPPAALTILAAITPKDIEVGITDENVEEVDFDEDVDLVGITAMTPTAPRAYQIADRFRARGVKVVLGGLHPTALPDEAIQHADAVVLGEAEGNWPKLLDDFKHHRLERFYSAPRPSLAGLPLPRRDLLKPGSYITTATVQTTRGCPFGCSFCSVTEFFGRTYRIRPVQEVLEEIRALKTRFVGFLDDNIVGHRGYARSLFNALIPERVKWLGQASLNLAWDPELLKLAQRSGCLGLFIGFESLSEVGLAELNKTYQPPGKFRDSIKRLQDHGIGIEGSFIFGLDSDSPDVFKRTLDFAVSSGLELASFGILTPFPGTRLYQRLEQERRIISRDWRKYDIGHVVYKPLKLTVEQLQRGLDWAWYHFYSFSSILKRIGSLKIRAFKIGAPLFLINTSYRKMLHRTI